MEKSEQFSDYLFAKMGPPHSTTVNGSELPPKTTERCEAPRELKGYRKWLSENLMLLVTLSGVMLGVILGFSLRPLHLHEDSIMLISYPGELFMRVLKLMILPLVISSLIAGSASLNARMNGKIALRTLVYFASTSLLNAALGIALVMLIHPGDPDLHNTTDRSTDKRAVNLLDSLLDLGRNVFPDNLFQASFQQAHTVYLPKPSITNTFNETVNDTALIGNGAGGSGGGGSGDGINDSTDDMVEEEPQLIRVIQYRSGTNTLGIVFFCLVFGTFLGTIGQKGQVVVDFFAAIFEVVMKMVTCVMWLTPVGISSVIAGKILSVNDLHLVMAQLMWFILTVAVGVVLYQLVIMQAIYYVFVRRNPFKFYAGLIQAMLTAFATASTAAALPVTFRCMNDKLRVDQRITRFVLPIGCNVNMDGTALFISIASIFIAQMSGMTLGFGELVTVLLTSTAASMSSASVPSAALVLLLVVLTAIDAPVQDVTLLFAVDWFVDRIRTTNNMLGDCYTAAVVEELSRKELMALDAAVLYQEIPISTPNGHVSLEGQTELDSNCTIPDAVIVDMNVVINKVHQQQQQQQQQQDSAHQNNSMTHLNEPLDQLNAMEKSLNDQMPHTPHTPHTPGGASHPMTPGGPPSVSSAHNEPMNATPNNNSSNHNSPQTPGTPNNRMSTGNSTQQQQDGQQQQQQQQTPPQANNYQELDTPQQQQTDEVVFSDNNPVDNTNCIQIPTSIENLIDLVADNGDAYEETLRGYKNQLHPALWFLSDKTSEQYHHYRQQIIDRRQEKLKEQQQKEKEELEKEKKTNPSGYKQRRLYCSIEEDKYDPESVISADNDSDDEYRRGMMDRNRDNIKRRIECRNELSEEERQEREAEEQEELRRMEKKKLRKSRWGGKIEMPESSSSSSVPSSFANQNKPLLTTVTRSDPALLSYAKLNYGSTNLSEEDWKKCEEHYKVNLLYQDMMRKRQEIDRLAKSGKFKYEYDSDEDVDGGTWEHKLRQAEMEATRIWALALTKQSEGKHHIGDFLPPEELKKFMEQYEAKKSNRQPDLSDYKEYKLKEDNIGFQMLQKLGWKEGQGLGQDGAGIVDPVNKGPQREGNQGLGVQNSATPEECDNEYDAYRKRMMLAYRFRPNPLNNPRRAYY